MGSLKKESNDQELHQAMYKSIESYTDIVKKAISDKVPKAIALYIISELEVYVKNNLELDFFGLSNVEYVSILNIIEKCYN